MPLYHLPIRQTGDKNERIKMITIFHQGPGRARFQEGGSDDRARPAQEPGQFARLLQRGSMQVQCKKL